MHKLFIHRSFHIKGFTLVELLISSVIIALVLISVYSVFHTSILGYRDIDENNRISNSARKIMEIINKDLRNCVAYSQDDKKFKGNNQNIQFITLVDSYQAGNNISEYAFISYLLNEDKLMRFLKKRQDSLNTVSDTKAIELMANIEDLLFRYAFFDLTQKKIKFFDSWDSSDGAGFPVAVEVSFKVKNKINQEFKRLIFLPLAE